jgi:hypothetical protein
MVAGGADSTAEALPLAAVGADLVV